MQVIVFGQICSHLVPNRFIEKGTQEQTINQFYS